MESKTPKEIMEKELPDRFKPEKAKGIDTTVQMDINGPSGGRWTVTIKDQKLEVKEGTNPSPKLAIEIKETDFLDLVSGKLNGTAAFFSGKLKLKGDVAMALKLRDAGLL
jgi:putative sterol carrier protein